MDNMTQTLKKLNEEKNQILKKDNINKFNKMSREEKKKLLILKQNEVLYNL